MPSSTDPPTVVVDRVLCSAHGVCAQLLPEQVTLDEWGYPIVNATPMTTSQAEAAVTWCPARALRLSR